jgi:autotransporter-associated beta strand protein
MTHFLHPFCNLLRNIYFFPILLLVSYLHSELLADSGFFTISPLADTYTRKDSATSNFGTENGIWTKKASTSSSDNSDRNGYLRFATTPFTDSSTWVEQASLTLKATSRPGNGTTYFSFDLYGMPDGHPDESFGETTLTFSNAANSSTNLPGSFTTNGLVYLGSVKALSTNVPQTMTWNGPALRDFIRDNRNSDLSFILVRSNAHADASSFASRENSDPTLRPILTFTATGDPFPSAVVTASSSDTGSSPANATDGSTTTRWSASPDSASTQSWIQLDLGTTRTINRFSFIPYEHGRTYKLEASSNGSAWTTLASGFRSSPDSTVNTNLTVISRAFPDRSARYLRLTSLTSLTGKNLGVVEMQASLNTLATPLLLRWADLSSQVATRTNTSSSEQVVRALLDVCLERALAGLHVMDSDYAVSLMNDIDSILASSTSQLAGPVANPGTLSVLRDLQTGATTTSSNPYLKRMNDGVGLFLGQSDSPLWEKNTDQRNELSNYNDARLSGQQMDALFWLFAHPQSPRRHHPEILRRLLRRTINYLDAMDVWSTRYNPGQLAGFFDDFGMGPASQVFREFLVLYPNLVPPNLKIHWLRAMNTAGSMIYSAHKDRVSLWYNTDVSLSCQLFNFGTVATNPDWLAKGEYFMNELLRTNGPLFADGAMAYYGMANEVGGYQGTLTEYVTRYHEMTGSSNALAILRGMEWYGPINGPIQSWWTVAPWKHMWNDIDSSDCGGEAAAGANAYVRAELDRDISGAATSSNWYSRPRVDVAWYRSGVTSSNRPDYTVYDRNIEGPRAWYGAWNYAATLRKIPNNEAGLFTIMGAQVGETTNSVFRVNSSLFGIFPRLRVSATTGADTDGTFYEIRHAWLASSLNGDATVRRDFSALGTSYRPSVYNSSSKGAEQDWTSRQVWLGLPDRIIGLLDVAPNVNTNAYEVQGVIRLGYGGTAASSPKTITATATNRWNYGNLTLVLHNHNYAALITNLFNFRYTNNPAPGASANPITELTLLDSPAAQSNTAPVAWTTGTRRTFLTEIRPNTASNDYTVTELILPNGLIGLEAADSNSNRKFRVVYNSSSNTNSYTPALTWTGTVRLHQSGARYRPWWLPQPTAPSNSIFWTTNQTNLSLPPYGHAVWETVGAALKANNSVDLDQEASWSNSGTSDGSLALWGSNLDTNSTAGIGNGINLAGLMFSVTSGPVSILSSGSGTLGLGSSGLDLSSARSALKISSPVRLDADQNWIAGTNFPSNSIPLEVSGEISGSGALTMAASNGATLLLSAANTFTGAVTVTAGSIRVRSSTGLGTGTKLVRLNSTTADAAMLLDGVGGPIHLGANFSFQISNPNGVIVNEAGTNLLAGSLTLTTGRGGSKIESRAGFLTLSGNILPNTTGRTLELSGSGDGRVTGVIQDGTSGRTLIVRKTGTGTWELSGSNTFTGGLTNTNGTLRLSGSLASPLVVSNATLAPWGIGVVNSNLTLAGTSRISVRINGTSAGEGYDQLRVAGTVALAGTLDPTLGITVSAPADLVLLQKESAGSVSGTFTGWPNGVLMRTNGFYAKINYAGGDGNDVVLRLAAAANSYTDWRLLKFGTVENTGNAADTADQDSDGLTNLAEYALGLNPSLFDSSPGGVDLNGSVLEYRYSRSLSARNSGVVYLAEWSDTLADNDWSTANVTETILSTSGDREEVKAAVPAAGTKRFMRLKILGI